MGGFEKFKVCQKATRKVKELELIPTLSLDFQLVVNQGSRNWVAAVALPRRRMALKKKMKTPISIFPPKREYFAPKRAQITQLTNNSSPSKIDFSKHV